MLALRAPAPPSMTFNQIAKYGSVEVSQTLNQVINATFCLRAHFSALKISGGKPKFLETAPGFSMPEPHKSSNGLF